jgi:hypothetical protein
MNTLTNPVTNTTTLTIYKFEIINVTVTPFTSALLSVLCYDNNNQFVSSKNITMDGTNYTNWSNNDQYLIDFVSINLN